jgi:hypothetical protein
MANKRFYSRSKIYHGITAIRLIATIRGQVYCGDHFCWHSVVRYSFLGDQTCSKHFRDFEIGIDVASEVDDMRCKMLHLVSEPVPEITGSRVICRGAGVQLPIAPPPLQRRVCVGTAHGAS